jgi:hypothetical protein
MADRDRNPARTDVPYDARIGSDYLWEVYDTSTNEVMTLVGVPLSGLDAEQAQCALSALKAGVVQPDRQRHPRAA